MRIPTVGGGLPSRDKLLADAESARKSHESAIKDAAKADKVVQDEKAKQMTLQMQLAMDNKAFDDAANKVSAAQKDFNAKKGTPGEAAAKAVLDAAEKERDAANLKVIATFNSLTAARKKVADAQKKSNLAKTKVNDALAKRSVVCDKMVAFLLSKLGS